VDNDLAMKMTLGGMNAFAMITFDLKKRLFRDLFLKIIHVYTKKKKDWIQTNRLDDVDKI